MIARRLVLPGELAASSTVLHRLASHISPQLHISLMDQYFPAHLALGEPVLGQKITVEEYAAVLDMCEAVGLETGWRQTTMETL